MRPVRSQSARARALTRSITATAGARCERVREGREPGGVLPNHHPHRAPVARLGGRAAATIACLSLAGAAMPAAGSIPPACGGIVAIGDLAGDGHHANSDVLSGWFAETEGAVHAVVRMRAGLWEPVHDDSDKFGVAVLFGHAGETRYVRVRAMRGAAPAFDHGRMPAPGMFVSEGAATGEVSTGPQGAVAIALPAALGLVPGAVLRAPYVLTYDGGTGADTHWVDRAPGGVSPVGVEFGADHVVGACGAAGLGPAPAPAPPAPGALDPAPAPAPAPALVGVVLRAPARSVGGRPVVVAGRVVPARSGVRVTLTSAGSGRPARTVVTGAGGTFRTVLAPLASARLRARAGGLSSQVLTLTVVPSVRVSVRRLPGGAIRVTGVVRPAVAGRALWLADGASRATATAPVRAGHFTIRLSGARSQRGRYQAVVIPSGGRAERAISNSVRLPG